MKESAIRLPESAVKIPATSAHRLSQPEEERGTVLYLAYGSNLSAEKFRVDRKIHPISQTNVQVPSLRLVFDLPGVPYNEPCFANSALRTADDYTVNDHYNKDDWHKGLIGAVYEVTQADYAHIIATEGGGTGYADVVVDCHPFETADPAVKVPQSPTTKPFKAHTLFASAEKKHERRVRHDPSYAQPSARYLKLITDGAAELALPYEYQDYLHSIRFYRITTYRQRCGQLLLATVWMPFILLFFRFSRWFGDENGIVPPWVGRYSKFLFDSIWFSYDYLFKPVFGEGERSIPDGGSYSNTLAEKPAVSELGMKEASTVEDVAAIAGQ